MNALHNFLMAMGYEHEYYPAEWEDVGDAENGPQLSGHNEYDCYVMKDDPRPHIIYISDGHVDVEYDYVW